VYTSDRDFSRKDVDVVHIPEALKGWYAKLYLFAPGQFEAGERIIYFDLDTAIVGPLDDMIKFKGLRGEDVRFAILRDVFVPSRYGPGIMMWKAGEWPEIWQYYVADNMPDNLRLGDLTWINDLFRKAGYIPHIIQDILPGKVCSYKVHAKLAIPQETSVVYFHGEPRPHDAGGWVEGYWNA
jgi:hypothetical protein